MKQVRFFLVAFLAAVAAPLPAQQLTPGQRLEMDSAVTTGTLPNGLHYYVRVNREPRNRAELRLVVNAGSILENDDQRGLAHFVEHMAFNGTEHFSGQELIDYLEGIGMRFGPSINAFTSFDETVYMLRLPTDTAGVMETAFQILADWAQGQTFDHEQIDKERGVVIEEWRRGLGAGSRIRDKQFPILFKGSRYAVRLPIGQKEILDSFDYDRLIQFYRDWYRPDLMAVVAVGDFDADSIIGLINGYFSELGNPVNERERSIADVPDNSETLVAIATDKELTSTSVTVAFKQPPGREETVDDYRQQLVESLYSSMFNQRLSELAQQADPPFIFAFTGKGNLVRATDVYTLGAGVKEDGIVTGLETVLREAERIRRFGFTATEFERSKKQMLRSIERRYAERNKTNSINYTSRYVTSFLRNQVSTGIEFDNSAYQQLVPTITLEEVNRLPGEWIVDRNRVLLLSAPEKEDMKVPTETELLAVFDRVAGDSSIEPYADKTLAQPLVAEQPAPATIVSEKETEDVGVTVWQLSNGVEVLLKPTDFKDDQIVFDAWSPGGSSLAADSDFIPAATSDAIINNSGVGDFDPIQLRNKLSGKSVNVGPYIRNLSEGISGTASPKDVETMFELIYLYFTGPRSDPTAFQSFKSRIQAFLKNRGANPNAAFQDTATVTLTQHHPRARPPTLELYSEMDLDKSVDFYRDRFRDASDFVFAFVGSFNIDSIRPLILTYIGGLPSINRSESWRDVGIEPPKGVIERVVLKGVEPVARTQIVFTGPFEWTRQNRHAIRSMAEAFQIMLREKLREDLGGTYTVGVSARPERDPKQTYSLAVNFGADPERIEGLVEEVFKAIDSLQTNGPPEEIVTKVKESQRRTRETNLRNNRYWLGQLMQYTRYGIDLTEIPQYEELIDRLDGKTIQEAARRYFNTRNYVRITLLPEKKPNGT